MRQGWYDDRRRYQFAFVVAIASGGVLGVGAMAWVWRRVLDRVWIAALGLGWMTSFVVIRAASFHHVETFLRGLTEAGNMAFEISGIAIVAAGAGQHPPIETRWPPGADYDFGCGRVRRKAVSGEVATTSKPSPVSS